MTIKHFDGAQLNRKIGNREYVEMREGEREKV